MPQPRYGLVTSISSSPSELQNGNDSNTFRLPPAIKKRPSVERCRRTAAAPGSPLRSPLSRLSHSKRQRSNTLPSRVCQTKADREAVPLKTTRCRHSGLEHRRRLADMAMSNCPLACDPDCAQSPIPLTSPGAKRRDRSVASRGRQFVTSVGSRHQLPTSRAIL